MVSWLRAHEKPITLPCAANGVTSLPLSAILALPQLQVVDVSQNPIGAVLDAGVWQALAAKRESLVRVDFGNCRLTVCVFCGCDLEGLSRAVLLRHFG